MGNWGAAKYRDNRATGHPFLTFFVRIGFYLTGGLIYSAAVLAAWQLQLVHFLQPRAQLAFLLIQLLLF